MAPLHTAVFPEMTPGCMGLPVMTSVLGALLPQELEAVTDKVQVEKLLLQSTATPVRLLGPLMVPHPEVVHR